MSPLWPAFLPSLENLSVSFYLGQLIFSSNILKENVVYICIYSMKIKKLAALTLPKYLL